MGLRHLMLARAGLLLAVLAAASPAAAQTIKVALEGSFIGPYAPFLVADDRGFYRAAGLNVTIEALPAPADPISRVAAGFADMGLADINAVVRFRHLNPGTPLKAVFMFYNKPPYAVVARRSRGIAQPKDLEGKRIGAPPGEMASALWPAFANLNDIDISKVKIESVAAAIREPMLAAGQIDAVTGTSFLAYLNLKERGVPLDDLVVLQMADYGLPVYGDAIIVNADFAAGRPDAVKGFLHAFLKGLRETIMAPARAVDSVVKRNDSAKKDIELERLRMAIQDNILTEEVQANGFGGVDPDRLMRGIDLVTHTLKLKNKIVPADVFDASFLPSAAERRIGAARPG
jgi:NitT/TauT family transport system substrate-binding protein